MQKLKLINLPKSNFNIHIINIDYKTFYKIPTLECAKSEMKMLNLITINNTNTKELGYIYQHSQGKQIQKIMGYQSTTFVNVCKHL